MMFYIYLMTLLRVISEDDSLRQQLEATELELRKEQRKYAELQANLTKNNKDLENAKAELDELSNPNYNAYHKRMNKTNNNFLLGVASGIGAAGIGYANRETILNKLGYQVITRPSGETHRNATSKETLFEESPRTIFSFVRFFLIVAVVLVLILICNYMGS